ncbi:DUF6514 family protein [uncultured Oscillibacter sp.]|uniref:DUF6514 family protein n=1 Tax=uncultured Oscillibacter sp. TaxID=876091 RepID=UPI00260379E0|nr:DUF6514 family protein [uncultured Oscillibacter sp.]
MKRRLAGESRCKDAALRYYLLTEESAAGPLYGVQAELGGEQAAVSGITTSRQRVQGLLDGLIRGQVTPVALRDVVDDWLLA